MKTSFLTIIGIISTLPLASCQKQSLKQENHEHCLTLKKPIEGKIYGVSQVWSSNGQRYALVVDLAEAERRSDRQETTTTFKYNEETRGVVKVDGHVPTSGEEKTHFLKLVNGRWEFTK